MLKRLLCMLGIVGLTAATVVSMNTPSAKAEKAPLAADRQMQRAARDLAYNLPRAHLMRTPFDHNVATNAFKLFMDMLDYEHVFFLQSDIDGFQASATNLEVQVAQGDLDFAFRVYDVLMQRISNRVEFVDQLLKKNMKFDTAETYRWKRKDAPYAADAKEWDDIWRKRIKNQLIAKRVADALGTNAVAKVEEDLDEDASTKDTHSALADAKLTPADFVRKSYRSLLTVLNDNDAGWIVERYLNAFTMSYDPHTSYMSPSSQEDFEISMNLSLCGIGALLGPEDGAAKIERLMPGGPAIKCGKLKAGDKIIGVAQGDGEMVDILHWPLNKMVRVIRGEKGSKVRLQILPASDTSGAGTIEVTLVRDEIKLEESEAKGEVRSIKGADGNTYSLGVIKLPEFYADMRPAGRRDTEPRSCSKDIRKILAQFKKQDVDGVALDLRGNGGGALNEAIEVAGLFLGSGPMVQVRDQTGVQALNYRGDDPLYEGPLVVLINRMSASASEIVAAALQDYGRAIVIGDSKTHGKGTVQSLTPISPLRPQLGSLKVTTANFYRVAGGSTQLKGVMSDIVIPSTLEALEMGEEFLPNALRWSRVPSASYERNEGVDRILPELARRSAERRAKDPKFAAMDDLIRRLREQQQTKDVSLKLDERIKQAKADRELQKQLEENDAAMSGSTTEVAAGNGKTGEGTPDKDGKPKEEKPKNDIVLNESLNILADWIRCDEDKAARAASGQAQPPKT